jgi:hypothetical protein
VLPPDPVLRAACRWLDLLQRSTLPTARELIRADSGYRDLTFTQYSTALDWLTSIGLLPLGDSGKTAAAPEVLGLDSHGIARLLFLRGIEFEMPPWLPDADLLVNDPVELPQDAARVVTTLGLTEPEAFIAVRQVHGKIDLAERSRVGAVGESALVRLLEAEWPESVVHLALEDDGLGYDVLLRIADRAWHLEIKSSTRKGRSVIYLSRNEFDVAKIDANWRLVIVRLDESDEIAAVNTALHVNIFDSAPQNVAPGARWESARFDVSHADQSPGLSFLSHEAMAIKNSLLRPYPNRLY